MPPTTPLEDRYGRSQKKNIALATWHAPLGGRVEEADLCRGQGFRRIAPSAPPRFEDRHVQGPPGSEGQEGILKKLLVPGSATHRLRAAPHPGNSEKRAKSRDPRDRQCPPEFGQRVR